MKSLARLAELPRNRDKAILGKTRDTIKRNILSTYEQILGANCYKNIDGGIELLGHRFYVVGLNDVKAVSKIKGMTLCYALGDEITEWMEEHYKMLLTRLSFPESCFDGTTNPASPNHWMYKMYTDLIGQDIGYNEDSSLFHFGLDDNLTLTQEYKDFLKRQYTGTFFERYILGKWVIAEGLVFDKPEVKPLTEFKKLLEEGYFTDFFFGIDWGWNHPTCVTCFAVDKNNRYWQFDELKKSQIQADEVIRYLREVQEKYKRYFRCGNADNARPEQNHLVRTAGFNVHDWKPDVKDRIAIHRQLITAGNMLMTDNCTETGKEYEMYRYPTQDELVRRSLDEDKPLKENDDCMDSVGYAISDYETLFNNNRIIKCTQI